MPPHMTPRGEYMAYTRAYPRSTSSTALGNSIVNQTWSRKSLRDSDWYQADLFSIHDSENGHTDLHMDAVKFSDARLFKSL